MIAKRRFVIRDWKQADAYVSAQHLNGAQWAWEFLRRNPAYQLEWSAFNDVWQQLEAAYGRPPNRDFCAWKADPRAWVPADSCTEGDCRIDGDKVLIECALGARWGFYKFPPDPRDDDPVGDQRLTWREVQQPVKTVVAADVDWFAEPAHFALGFDLSVPLRDQVEQAKRTLQAEQRRRLRAELIRSPSAARRADEYRVMLRLLDAETVSASADELASISQRWEHMLEHARGLRDAGYRQLSLLQD